MSGSFRTHSPAKSSSTASATRAPGSRARYTSVPPTSRSTPSVVGATGWMRLCAPPGAGRRDRRTGATISLERRPSEISFCFSNWWAFRVMTQSQDCSARIPSADLWDIFLNSDRYCSLSREWSSTPSLVVCHIKDWAIKWALAHLYLSFHEVYSCQKNKKTYFWGFICRNNCCQKVIFLPCLYLKAIKFP